MSVSCFIIFDILVKFVLYCIVLLLCSMTKSSSFKFYSESYDLKPMTYGYASMISCPRYNMNFKGRNCRIGKTPSINEENITYYRGGLE
jgi:hypothetical protein